MPLVADPPKAGLQESQVVGYAQSTVLSGLSGSAWERSLAQSLANVRQTEHSLLATADRVYAVLLGEVKLDLADFDDSTGRSWVREAGAVFPGSRSMTSDERAAYGQMRRRLLRRVE
jgi:hypothetical protein